MGGILAVVLLSAMLPASYVSLYYISHNYRIARFIRPALIAPEMFFAWGYKMMGQTFAQNGEYDEAIVQFQKSIQLYLSQYILSKHYFPIYHLPMLG